VRGQVLLAGACQLTCGRHLGGASPWLLVSRTVPEDVRSDLQPLEARSSVRRIDVF
jgi:hypothetical protein